MHLSNGKIHEKIHTVFHNHLVSIFSSSVCALQGLPGTACSTAAKHGTTASQPRTRTTHRNASIKLSTARRKPRSPATQPASQHVSQQHPNQAQQQSQPASQPASTARSTTKKEQLRNQTAHAGKNSDTARPPAQLKVHPRKGDTN